MNTTDKNSRLSPEKQALLENRLFQKLAARAPKPTHGASPGSDRHPLSFAQESLWFFNQLVPNSPLYNIPQAIRLSGPIDAGVLQKALAAIVERHETLRTRFVEIDGRPVQVVSPHIGFTLPTVDLSGCAASERETKIACFLNEEARCPFDLTVDPMLRASLVRTGSQEYLLLLSVHHIAADALSLEILHRELTALYQAFRDGSTSPLPPLRAGYFDVIESQRQSVRNESMERQIAYWKQELAGDWPVLALPQSTDAEAIPAFRGSRLPIHFPSGLLDALRQLSRRHEVTLYTTLLAAFQTLLHRYSGQDRILVGSPIGARPSGDAEALIGLFLNMTVLKTDFTGNPRFETLLRSVRGTVIGALANQDVPLDRLIDELGVPRLPGRQPLFQAVFQFMPAPVNLPAFPGVVAKELPMETGTAKFDVTLTLVETSGGLVGDLEYNTDLYDSAMAHRMIRHFQSLLESICANPTQPVESLAILTHEEECQLLGTWNDTAVPYPRQASVASVFSHQAASSPNAVALILGDRQLTYRELETRANRLANHLIALGVTPGARVGVCLERSFDVVVALLAVLKAGAAYVPLDAAYPVARLAYMIADANAPLIVTMSAMIPRLSETNARFACLDLDSEAIDRQPSECVPTSVTGDDIAYIIYTSGSTGRPKGVAVTQRAVVRLVKGATYARFGPEETFFLFAPTSFDASTFEIWGALLNGARLVVSPPGLDSLEELGKLIQRHHVTTLWLTAGLFHQMIDSQIDSLLGVKQLLAGGDVLSVPHVLKAVRELPDTRIINGYGPTENTTFTCCHTVPSDWSGGRSVPIGRPISNTQVFILDRQRAVAPIGVVGELYCAGDGLAREYLNAPELTNERFVSLALPGRSVRAYRTGDLARWLPDGTIEFLGRGDQQLKIRGFRVEPGEIERALASHPAIRQAVVVAREDSYGQKYLAAYIAAQPASIDTAGVRAFLNRKLPAHMIPSRVVTLDELPLTANGKIDRARLPAPPEAAVAILAPRTPQEHLLAQIWTEVLGGRPVGLNDNFFDCGGHSLLATRVISRVAKATGVTLSLRHFFEQPTLQMLAAELAHAAGNENDVDPIFPAPINADAVYPLSFPQQRLWFVDQLQSRSAVYNIPLVYHLRGPLDAATLERSLRTLAQRHEILRTTCVSVHDSPAQKVTDGSGFTLPVRDLTTQPDLLQECLAQDACAAFDLASGPVFRAHLFRLAAHEHVLLLNIHHIAFDEWSIDILHEELPVLYAANAASRAAVLDPLPIQYRDFALWQHRNGDAGGFATDIDYWKKALANSGPPLELPADRPRPANPTCKGGLITRTFPQALSDAVRALCRKEGVTPYVLLLAAFDTLLYRYTGREDVVVGIPVAGRTRLETERLVGFFVNMLPMRADLSGNPSFRELLTRVREANLQAMAHQQAPFEKVVEALHASRERLPLFGIVFTVQHQPAAFKLPQIEVKPLMVHPGTAKFDLTMVIQDQGDGADLGALLEYNSGLFNEETLDRLLLHFQTLLQSVIANPAQPISKLPILTRAERDQLARELNDTATPFPRTESIDTLFEAQARRTPRAIAVRYGAESITYGELNDRSTRMAGLLGGLGVGPDTPVGVFVERSIDMVVTWIAVLKAGGAYVPLDLDYPAEWIRFVLEDTRMPVVITRRAFADKLPQGVTRTLFLDSAWSAGDTTTSSFAMAPLSSERLAYIIYTSGSTGRPKGVAVPHRAIVRLLFETNYVHLDGSERMGQVSNSAFDAATFEVWGALLFGGTLVGAAKETILSPSTFAAFLAEEKITTMFLTTALFNQVAAELPDAFASMRDLLVGGAACDPDAVRRVLAHKAPQRLLNAYGPTESTTFAAWHEIKTLAPEARSVPIGRPLANTTLHVLDGELQPAPIGVQGELYIGGDGLARCYFNRPELTAERFIRDPFSADPQARLYKTGDRARRLADGSIDFMGRLDEQVKIRGFRIEPGEIQFALKQAPGVKDALVIVREDTPGEKRLVAYYIAPEETAPSAAHLRQFLREKLPPHMIPSSYHRLDAFPLTPNGKVDHRALPTAGAPRTESAHCPPRTELEIQLFEVWKSVLDQSSFGIQDDFFEIGGHSLLAVRLVAEMEKAIGIRLPLPILFQSATIEKLAQALSQNAPFSPGSCLVKIQPNGTRPPIFWPHTLGGGAGGGLFTYRKLAQLLGPDQPSYGFVAPAQPFTSIETMAAHYIQEMKRIQPAGPYLIGGYCFAGVVAYEMARQLQDQGEQIGMLALLDSSPPDPDRERTRPSLKLAAHFVRTFPHWFRDFVGQDAGEIAKTVKWKTAVGLRKLRNLWRKSPNHAVSNGNPQFENLDDLVDMSAYPQEYRRFARVHWDAFTLYRPKPFPGRAVLFRGEESYLLRLDGVDSWRKLALGGLEVRKIAGKHDDILAEPCVRSLATQLGECLRLASTDRLGNQKRSGSRQAAN